MGSTESKPTKAFQDQISFYEKTNQSADYRFGDASIWVKKATKGTNYPEHVMVKEKWSMNSREYDKFRDYIKSREGIHHENLCDLKAVDNHVENSWCSNYYKTFIAIEYHDTNLGEELNRRRRLLRDDPSKWMTEPEMWYIIK